MEYNTQSQFRQYLHIDRVLRAQRQAAARGARSRLQPLTQWICDNCGGVVPSPDGAWLEWRETEGMRAFGFRILHHATTSPLRKFGFDCYSDPSCSGLHLLEFLGPDGMTNLFTLLYMGVLEMGEWCELVRRCQIPEFEEARRHFRSTEDYRRFAESSAKLRALRKTSGTIFDPLPPDAVDDEPWLGYAA